MRWRSAGSAARFAFAQPSPLDIGERLTRAQQDGSVSGLHALLVSQGRRLVFEYYGRGEHETFAPGVLHELRSVSKSVIVLVYGIALAAGKVPPPEARLYDQFPEYSDLAKQPGRARLTVQHVLNLTLGLEWDETRAIAVTPSKRRPTVFASSLSAPLSASLA
jgi:CubicO group peptidase (beta-lactamase class C family)